MITPITSAHPIDAWQVAELRSLKPVPQAQTPPVQKSGALSQDEVTLKIAGQPDHDADDK